jgi:hypothetical protein
MRFLCPWPAVAVWLALGMATGSACYAVVETDLEPDGAVDELADGATDRADETTLPPAETWLWYVLPTAGRGYANAVAETDDAGVLLAGFVEASTGGQTAWVTRFAHDGSVVWDESLVGWVSAMVPHPAGGFVIAGTGTGAMLLHLDASGVPVWSRSAAGVERADALAPVADGFWVAGSAGATSTPPRSWIARVDLDGNALWAKDLLGISLAFRGQMVASRDGSAIVAAHRGGWLESGEVWVARFAPDGPIVWQAWTGSPASFNQGPGIVELSDGDVVVTYGSGSDILVLRLDASGVERWRVLVGGPDEERGAMAIEAPGGGIVVASTETSFHGEGSPNLWLFALDASGSLLWQRSVESDGLHAEHGLIPTRDGAFIAVSGGCCGSWVAKLRFDGSFDGECATLPITDGAARVVTRGLTPGDVVVTPATVVFEDRLVAVSPSTTSIEKVCGE